MNRVALRSTPISTDVVIPDAQRAEIQSDPQKPAGCRRSHVLSPLCRRRREGGAGGGFERSIAGTAGSYTKERYPLRAAEHSSAARFPAPQGARQEAEASLAGTWTCRLASPRCAMRAGQSAPADRPCGAPFLWFLSLGTQRKELPLKAPDFWRNKSHPAGRVKKQPGPAGRRRPQSRSGRPFLLFRVLMP